MFRYDLVIDPGHGGRDPGGGQSVDPWWLEKDMVLQISLYQYERAKQLGINAALTRDKDVTLTNADRVAKVKQGKYCLSNHTNAAIFSARGAETIYSIHTDGTLANRILDEIVREGMAKRRAFSRKNTYNTDYYYIIRETRPTETIIVEYGFGTNQMDARLIYENWKTYAEAALRGLCFHVGWPYTPPKKEEDSLIQGKATVVVGDKKQEGYLIENTTYVPIRFVTEALGAKISWNNKTKTATITKGD